MTNTGRPVWPYALLVALAAAGAFYWYEWRPSSIRSACARAQESRSENFKSTYEEFLKRYPNDPDYVDDAENALKFLGIPPEEIIKQFEKNPQ